jgi:hypothetical protein
MRKTLLIVLLALSFSACKKNDVSKNPPDKLLVKTITFTYPDGDEILEYNYDSKNHLSGLSYHTTGSLHSGVAGYVYTYDSDGNIIKTVATNNGTANVINYAYVNGVPITFTNEIPGNPPIYRITNIITANNQVIGTSIQHPGEGMSKQRATYNNGNLVTEITEDFSAIGALIYTYMVNSEYGTKKSPFLYSGNKWNLSYTTYSLQK